MGMMRRSSFHRTEDSSSGLQSRKGSLSKCSCLETDELSGFSMVRLRLTVIENDDGRRDEKDRRCRCQTKSYTQQQQDPLQNPGTLDTGSGEDP
jgi:hypothetical protein